MPRLVVASIVFLAALSCAGSATAATPPSPRDTPDFSGQFSDCFWSVGAINGGSLNIAYPDAGANYWAALYTVPPGATLRLHGTYPHARYASVQAYNGLGAIQDALADFQIDPDPGSLNPFRPGVSRATNKRSFTVTLADDSRATPLDPDQRTDEPASDALHTAPPGDTPGGVRIVLWRVYVPDNGTDLRGGVELPQPELTLSDGTVLTGQAACDALTSQVPRLPDPSALLIPEDQYNALRYQPGKPAWFPAEPDPVWRVQYNRDYLLALYTGEDIPNPPKSGQTGFFPNLHNQYARAALNRKLGKVVALRGKMATTPATSDGERKLGRTQLRYQSFCMNESVLTTRVMDCVYDEQVPLHGHRRYLVVTSRRADRPDNATRKCGVAWVRWSKRGDGGTDHDFGWMQVRNMLPSPSFHHAVQDTRVPGDEHEVLGPYLPKATYYDDKRAFEKLGCPAR
jgi:hypothetical protein